MSQDEKENYPASAIATWSGYVYQGKIALYHSLKLILENNVDFELQLDSSDDFAIYKDGALLSSHQVKAKIGKYRKSYQEALEKSAAIEFDRVRGVSRFFHLSVQLDNTSDYIGSNGEQVKFYLYGDKSYCGLGEIEGLTKEIIRKIYLRNSITLSEDLLNYNYCILSEKISSKAVEIHRIVQEDRVKANKAAYNNRITAKSILENIISNNPYNSIEYYAVDLKAKLHSHLEDKLDQSLPGMSDIAYKRARRLYEHIHKTNTSELRTLCQLMKPSERFSSIQKADIRRYSELIQAMNVEPIFHQLPHYLDSQKRFYIPTALDLPIIDDREGCITDILGEMESNGDLLKLLFEYNHLIASRSTESFVFNTKFTNADEQDDDEIQENIDSNIIRTLCIHVVTKEDAENRLNDY